MRRVFIFFTCLFVAKQFYSQHFYKGALVTELKTGFELSNIYADVTHKSFSGTSRDTIYTDKAANTYFGFSGEYGLHKNLGIGIGFNSHNFLSETDSVSGKKQDTRANGLLLIVNYHPVNTKRLDLVIGGDLGYSGFKLKTFDKENTILSGNGIYMSAYINPRIYFGRFGVNFRLSTPFMRYGSVTTNNSEFNKYNTYNSLKLTAAWGIGFGIQYRFLSEK
jgi:hypothetical protein